MIATPFSQRGDKKLSKNLPDKSLKSKFISRETEWAKKPSNLD